MRLRVREMTIDSKIKKTVTELINKERDVSVSSIPNQPNMSIQDLLKKSKELLDDNKRQVGNALKKGKSVMVVMVSY